jgi:hypothetical protein
MSYSVRKLSPEGTPIIIHVDHYQTLQYKLQKNAYKISGKLIMEVNTSLCVTISILKLKNCIVTLIESLLNVTCGRPVFILAILVGVCHQLIITSVVQP